MERLICRLQRAAQASNAAGDRYLLTRLVCDAAGGRLIVLGEGAGHARDSHSLNSAARLKQRQRRERRGIDRFGQPSLVRGMLSRSKGGRMNAPWEVSDG